METISAKEIYYKSIYSPSILYIHVCVSAYLELRSTPMGSVLGEHRSLRHQALG